MLIANIVCMCSTLIFASVMINVIIARSNKDHDDKDDSSTDGASLSNL